MAVGVVDHTNLVLALVLVLTEVLEVVVLTGLEMSVALEIHQILRLLRGMMEESALMLAIILMLLAVVAEHLLVGPMVYLGLERELEEMAAQALLHL